MPTTTNRGYASPAHGGAVDSWDSDLNSIFNQIDQNFGAVSNVALSNIPVTLSAPQYVCGTIRFSGTLTGNVVVTFPSVSGWWVVENVCTGSFYVQLTCGAGNRICAPPGESVDVLTDGSGFRYRNLGRIGAYEDFATLAVPTWISQCTVPPYLLCDASSFSAVTYPALAAFLGGTTLPDARGRARFAYNGVTGRLTTLGGIDGNTLFASGGFGNGITLLQASLPNVSLNTTIPAGQGSHTHPVSGSGGVMKFVGLGGDAATTAGANVSTGATIDNATLPQLSGTTSLGGGGTPFGSVPPGFVGGITMIRAA